MNILDIEFKQDTEEKLAKVAGKPTENFLFSKEINKIVNAIKLLGNMITVNSATIDQLLANNIKIELGEVPDNLLDFINFSEVPIEIAKNAFLVYKIGEVNYVSVYTGETQSYGGGIEEQLTEENLVLLYQSNTPSANPIITEYELLGVIRQTGSEDPTLQVVKNTFPGIPDIFEIETAQYIIRIDSGEFTLTSTKTVWHISPPSTQDDANNNGRIVGYNVGSGILIGTVDNSTGSYTRGFIDGVTVSIRYVI